MVKSLLDNPVMSETGLVLTQETRAYLAQIGRLGGQVGGRKTSPEKRVAVRRNGRLGGRPRKPKEPDAH